MGHHRLPAGSESVSAFHAVIDGRIQPTACYENTLPYLQENVRQSGILAKRRSFRCGGAGVFQYGIQRGCGEAVFLLFARGTQ
jgi:hypothetical protein